MLSPLVYPIIDSYLNQAYDNMWDSPSACPGMTLAAKGGLKP